MIRYAQIALMSWITVATAAADMGRWVLVEGGSWTPKATILPELDAALKPVVAAAAKGRGELHPWSHYVFQYQGITLLGKKIVYVNASCFQDQQILEKEWVRVMDGGACFFNAKYDPEKKMIYDVEVNGDA